MKAHAGKIILPKSVKCQSFHSSACVGLLTPQNINIFYVIVETEISFDKKCHTYANIVKELNIYLLMCLSYAYNPKEICSDPDKESIF